MTGYKNQWTVAHLRANLHKTQFDDAKYNGTRIYTVHWGSSDGLWIFRNSNVGMISSKRNLAPEATLDFFYSRSPPECPLFD